MLDEVDWPTQPTIERGNDVDIEKKSRFIAALTLETSALNLPDISRFSKWIRLIRSTAWTLLTPDIWIRKMKTRPSANNLKEAEKQWIMRSQRDSFHLELNCLLNNEQLPKDSRLRYLTPKLNEDNILIVDGRATNVKDIDTLVNTPVILDGKHRYTRLLVQHYHEQFAHGTTETVVNELRQKYWLINLRRTVKTVTSQCQRCRIDKAKVSPPRMSCLPRARLEHHERPFTNTGIDYFGPMNVAVGRRREKRWGVLFTCLVSRAVHIEVASSLTTDSAMMALQRMGSRRGYPSHIFSDNGTNLRGANEELKRALREIDQTRLQDYGTNKGIEWHFIPPASPHMGGSWERLIRSVKTALKAILRERTPTDECLTTLLIEVEHMVNSRPLTHVSSDPKDPEAITPNHFLIGGSSGFRPSGIFIDADLYRKKKWRIPQILADMFWSRWLKEYLPTIIIRKRWQNDEEGIKLGDVVVIVDHTLLRNSWPKGVVERLFPGDDRRIRVVEVKTNKGLMTRSVINLIKLPTDPLTSNDI